MVPHLHPYLYTTREIDVEPRAQHDHPVALAAAYLLMDAEISPEELASRVGVKRTTLYKASDKWISIRRVLMAREARHEHTPSDE